MKVITIDSKKCVGCKNCEMACAYNRTKETCANEESNIKVTHFIDERIVLPMTCLHCEDAPCMTVCPAKAISKDDTLGVVVIDKNKCAGCKMCMLVCAYGNIHFDHEALVSRKCNLCEGNPKCVGHCISGALQFEELEDLMEKERLQSDERMKEFLGKHGE